MSTTKFLSPTLKERLNFGISKGSTNAGFWKGLVRYPSLSYSSGIRSSRQLDSYFVFIYSIPGYMGDNFPIKFVVEKVHIPINGSLQHPE